MKLSNGIKEKFMEITEISTYNVESLGAVAGYAVLAALLVYVVHSLLLGRVFKKAGFGYWRAWVPVVRDWTFFKAGAYKGTNIFWYVGAIIAYAISAVLFTVQQDTFAYIASGVSIGLSITYIGFHIAAVVSLQKKLGKPGIFVILYFINLIAPLWLWILALDYSKYNKKKGHQLK